MFEFAVPVYPPQASPAVCIPNPVKDPLAVFKLPPVDHAPTGTPGPIYDSVTAVVGGALPPENKAPEEFVPELPPAALAVDKSPCSDQLVPL